MNDTTLRQWRLFLAVVESGSVAGAAERVSLTQPAVSQGLGQLEQRLGQRLFDRVGRGMVLNDRGRALVPEARALLAQARRCEQLFQVPPLQVVLAATHTPGSYYLPERLAGFRRRHPGAQVRLEVVNSDQALARLQELAVDLALVEGDVPRGPLQWSRWCDDLLLRVTTPERLPELNGPMARWPWVMREAGSGTRAIIEQRLGPDFPAPSAVLELGSAEAVRQALLAGAGVGYASALSIADALRRGRLVGVPGKAARILRPLHLVRHVRRELGPGGQALLDWLQQEVPRWSDPEE